MSDVFADSTVNDEEEGERRVRNGRSEGMMRRLKTLFCCFKREPREEKTVEYDPDECDYIVEKLVVRRVPLALFAIPADLADDASRSTSSSALGGDDRAVNITRETSARIGTNRIAANEALRFGDERRDSIGGRQVHSRDKFARKRDIKYYFLYNNLIINFVTRLIKIICMMFRMQHVRFLTQLSR